MRPTVVSSYPRLFSLPCVKESNCPGDGLMSSKAHRWGGVRGRNEEGSADGGLSEAKGPFAAVAGVGQHKHYSYGLGVGGAKT